jgi:hypothetical protein
VTGHPGSADLLRLVERLRTRAGLTRVVALVVPAAGLAIGLAELLRVFALDGTLTRAALTIPAAVLIVAAAAGFAWRLRPAMTDVARDADRRLGLQASVVTAWQFRDAADAFAARTRARALDGLRAVEPGAVYPWRLSRAGVACLAIGVVASLGVAVRPGANAPSRRTAATAGAAGRLTLPGTPDTATDRSAASPAAPAPQTPPQQQTPPSPVPEAAPQPNGDGDRTPPAPARAATPQPDPGEPGALTTAQRQGRSGVAAPGGGRTGGTGAATPGGLADSGPPPVASASATTVARAPGLERVPMHRRAYVRRYLLSRAEPR